MSESVFTNTDVWKDFGDTVKEVAEKFKDNMKDINEAVSTLSDAFSPTLDEAENQFTEFSLFTLLLIGTTFATIKDEFASIRNLDITVNVDNSAAEKKLTLWGLIVKRIGEANTLANGSKNLRDAIKKLFDDKPAEELEKKTGKVATFIGTAFEKTGAFIANIPDTKLKAWDGLKTAGIYVATAIKGKWGELANFMSPLTGVIKKGWSKLRINLGEVPENLKKKWKDFTSFVGKIGSGIGEVFKKSFKGVGKVLISIGGKIKSSVNEAVPAAKESSGKIGQIFGKAFSGIKIIGKSAFTAIAVIIKAVLLGAVLVAVAAIAGLILCFKDLMNTNESFKESVTTAWAKVGEAFTPAIEAFQNLIGTIFAGQEGTEGFTEGMLNIVTTIIDSIAVAVEWIAGIITEICSFIKQIWEENGTEIMAGIQAVGDFFAMIWNGACEIFGQIIEILKIFWDAFGEDIINVVKTAWEFVSSIFGGAINIIKGILDIVVGIFTGNGEKIKEGFGEVWEGITGIFSGFGDFFSGLWEIISGWWDEHIAPIFTKEHWSKLIKDAVEGIKESFNLPTIEFKCTFSATPKGLYKIAQFLGLEGVPIPKFNITYAANGGMFEPGQLFLAREAGPELVGSFGSHTAVMNNNQIVESVSKGVYDAVYAVMSKQGNRPIVIENKTYLDGKQITATVEKYQRERGVQLISGNLGYTY